MLKDWWKSLATWLGMIAVSSQVIPSCIIGATTQSRLTLMRVTSIISIGKSSSKRNSILTSLMKIGSLSPFCMNSDITTPLNTSTKRKWGKVSMHAWKQMNTFTNRLKWSLLIGRLPTTTWPTWMHGTKKSLLVCSDLLFKKIML